MSPLITASIAVLSLASPATTTTAEPEGVVPSPATTRAGPAEDETQPDPRPVPWVSTSVGGGAVWGGDPTRTIQGGAFRFGIEGGALLQPRPRLRIGLGGAFAQTGHGLLSGWPARGNTDLLAKIRVGPAGPRVWGYGTAAMGFSLATEDMGDAFARDFGPAALLGLGLAVSFPNRTSLSFELDGAVMYLPPDGWQARLTGSLVFGWRFGRR